MVVLQHGSTTKEHQGSSVFKVCRVTFLALKCIAKSQGYQEISFEIVFSVSKSGTRHYVLISERCDYYDQNELLTAFFLAPSR